jgi:alkyl hydroperoxide reductase subunit AhpF
MTRRMGRMTNSIDDIPIKMNAMEDPDLMRSHIRSMNASMRNMTITGNQMRNETTCRGPHIDHPLSKMNSIFSC